jgi:aryl-alcohol dehydrogenase-like predicted oxidoreductase
VQVDYSPFQREIEDSTGTNLLATCREFGVAVVCAMPLGRGMVTSTFASGEPISDSNDRRSLTFPRFMEDNRDKNAQIVRDFKNLADKRSCSVAQLALAWLLKQGGDIFPIPGHKENEVHGRKLEIA